MLKTYAVALLWFAVTTLQVSSGDERVSELLRSTNAPPKFVDKHLVNKEGFSWDEYNRIKRELKVVSHEITPARWLGLVEAMKDEHYCTTIMSPSATIDTEDMTVGECCETIVQQYLVAGLVVGLDIYNDEFRSAVGSYGLSKKFQAKLLSFPETTSREGLCDWLKTRKEKDLRQLQIEICRNAIAYFERVDLKPENGSKSSIGESQEVLPKGARVEIVKAINKQIVVLEKRKDPVLPKWRIEDSFEFLNRP